MTSNAWVWVVMSNCVRAGTKVSGEPLLWTDLRGTVLLLFSTLENAQAYLRGNKTTAERAEVWEMDYDKCVNTIGRSNAHFAVIDPGPSPADWQLRPIPV